MPDNNLSPTIALVAGADLSPWRGLDVFKRFATFITLPAWASPGDGLFADLLTALNGRGEHLSLGQRADALVAAWSPTDSMSITINADDLVEISSTVQFELSAGPETVPLGFVSGASYLAALVGSDWVVTAPSEWVRGPLDTVEAKIFLDPLGVAFPISAVAEGYHQDVVTLLRSSGVTPETDEDAPTDESLQYLDNDGMGDDDTTWSLDEDGRVVISWTSTSSSFDPDWLDDSFREWLGFTGLEAPVRFGATYSTLTGTYLPAGVVVTELAEFTPGVARDGEAVQVGRDFYPLRRGDYPTLSFSTYLRGPAACGDDQITHFHERFVGEVPQGGRFNLYQQWGDPRRALRDFRVGAAQDAYSLSRTSELDGRRGRLVARLIPGVDNYRADWPNRITMEARYAFDLQIVED